jgi:hypothetical protein
MAPLGPTQKLKIRRTWADFMVRAEAHRLAWFYNQVRPFKGFGVPPEATHVNDCSGYASLGAYFAAHTNNIWLPDPIAGNYTGWGYTGTAYAYLKAHPAPEGKYMVGDMAIFGSRSKTVHMIICRKAGDGSTAVFSSNGHQDIMFIRDAPEPISLLEAESRLPLVGVYRHPSLL